MQSLRRACVAECFGTFVLVLAGTGAITIDAVSGGRVTHVGIVLTFGLVVGALVCALGDVSGAHLNPAVTIGFWSARRFPRRHVAPYLLCQLSGALGASLTLRLLFPAAATLGATHPAGVPLVSAALELLLTNVLMFVIRAVATGAKEKGMIAGAAIGAVVAFEALFAGPISGASMNPARSLAPAAVSGDFEHLWIYLVAPVLGALLAVPLCRATQRHGCCTGPCEAVP